MSTPNPLIPQGTFQAQAAKGASNVRLAVATIVAIHIVFFGGLLLQGCKRDPQASAAAPAPETNSTSQSDLSLAPLDTNSLYYPEGGLPPDTGMVSGNTSQIPAASQFDNSPYGNQPVAATNPEALWQSSNLSTPGTEGTLATGAENNTATKEYTIVRGDTLGAIALRNKVSLSALLAANPGVEPKRIRPGQKLQIPASDSTPSSNLNNTQGTGNGSGATYTVVAGDTLTKIARKHGTTVSQLRAANDLRTSRVNIGQKLKIPAPANAAPTAVPTNSGF